MSPPPLNGRLGVERLRRAFTRLESLEVLDGLDDRLRGQNDLQHLLLGEVRALRYELGILRRSHDVLARELTLPPDALWRGVLAGQAPGARSDRGKPWLGSRLCRQADLEDPVFLGWMARLREPPVYHRKQWEFGYIAQALWERGLLRKGGRGLGFGVGGEPLSALFAAQGCTIVATDLAGDRAGGAGWIETDQHAAGLESLRKRDICDAAAFEARVSFRPADMSAIDGDLTGFDFCWSACALEHLGDIAAGLRFIERSLDTLKPGGWAIHTTEFNLTSATDTIECGPTVMFRQSDLEGLAATLRGQGHAVEPFDWSRGDRPLDRYIDLPPYLQEQHLRLLFDGYAATSVGMIVQKAH